MLSFARRPPLIKIAVFLTLAVPLFCQDSQTTLPRVTTTVDVHGQIEETYEQGSATLGGFESLPLQETPVSGMVITRGVLDDQQARVLSDVTKNDASVGEDYAPVGYYQDFQIRGFPIDLGTGLKINGLTIAGEQPILLENKQSVEILEGLAAVEAGIASPGGLVNFTTKRPADVRVLTLATDHRGSAYGNFDWGSVVGARKQFGVRTNIGAESIRTYVNHADGSREFGTLGADWSITPNTYLRGDFEYQHQEQRSVAGYQLLGGAEVPTNVAPSVMLGYQPWARPNTFDIFNASLRFDHKFNENWNAYATAGRSHSLIGDYVAYPYGCYYEDACNSGAAPYPYFFSPAGDYDVYDYRSPGELRIDDQFQAILSGRVKTAFLRHNLIAGTSLLRRSVNLASPVYDYVGTDNIYQPLRAFAPSPNSPGPVTLQEDSHQYALILQDRIELPGRVGLLIGGQVDTIHDHNYSQPDAATGTAYSKVTKIVWLPQYAVTYRPLNFVTLYGNYGVALSLGPQAPFWAVNGSVFLDPYFTRQVEIGAKFKVNSKLLLGVDAFRMTGPFFYPKPVADGVEFVSQGHENHRGIEFSAQGTATPWLRFTASAAAISALAQDTGTMAFDNKQIINQPRFRSALFADIQVPFVRGLAVLPGWTYTGAKAATRDEVVSVPSYNLFSAGLRYTPRAESRVTFRLYADNLTNKRYWKDTGANYGDTFLHLGAPTTVRLSTQFAF